MWCRTTGGYDARTAEVEAQKKGRRTNKKGGALREWQGLRSRTKRTSSLNCGLHPAIESLIGFLESIALFPGLPTAPCRGASAIDFFLF